MHTFTSNSAGIANPQAEEYGQSPAQNAASVQSGNGPGNTWFSAAVLCLMTATMLALFWFPLRRTFTNVEVNYNEGWNAYRAAMVAHGIRLYDTPPHGFGTGTAYPPISFHLISRLGNEKTFPLVGRLISLVCVLATGVFVALIVRKGGGSVTVSIFSFLLYEIAIAILRADRLGMNDPQLLGEALCAGGLFFYVLNPRSKRILCVSALFFCLAGFTKHNLIAFPAVVAIDLLLRSRKAFLTWFSAMLVTAGLLTSATMLVDGRYFFVHLLGGGGGRAYSYWVAWSQFHHYEERFQSLLVVATAWSLVRFRSRTLFVSAFVLSHGLAFLLGGGFGVDLNIFFNGLAATAIVCGLALSDIEVAFAGWRSNGLNAAAATMFGFFFISVMMFVPGQLRRDRKQLRALPLLEKQFNAAVEFLRLHPGPAMCESHLLCYEAGKPFEFEPFSVRDQLKTGRLHEDDVLALLKTRHFQTVEINIRSDEEKLDQAHLLASLGSDQTEPDTERFFTPSFMQELLKDYRLSLRTAQMAVFCPN